MSEFIGRPNIKVRIGDREIQAIVTGAQKHGILNFYSGRFQIDYESNSIYLTVSATAGKYPDMIPISIDALIPIPEEMLPKEPKTLKETNEDQNKKDSTTILTIADDTTVHELKSTQMDVVGDLERHVDVSGTVRSGIDEGPELSKVSAVGEGIQSEV